VDLRGDPERRREHQRRTEDRGVEVQRRQRDQPAERAAADRRVLALRPRAQAGIDPRLDGL
jgi:hypothetical protein